MNKSHLPQRVLMTVDSFGGVWTYAMELSRALGGYGTKVVLAAMGAPLTPHQERETRNAANLTLFCSTFKLEWMRDPWEDVRRAGEWLLRIEREFQPDIVHLNGYVHGALPWHAPVLTVAHSCVYSWWTAVRGAPVPECWDRYRNEVSRGVQAAGLVVAPSSAMMDSIEYYYGPVRCARVIPNGIGVHVYAPAPKEPFILSAGRLWDEAKNIGAMGKVAPHLPWPVYVAGDDRHPEGGSARIEGVRCLGRLAPSDLARWYARASIYALPARYEPFGLTPVEAGLSGCALVLGDIASLREIWGDAAVFVPPEDERATGDAIKELIFDDGYRKTMADLALQRSRQFSLERMADEYLDAYNRMLNP